MNLGIPLLFLGLLPCPAASPGHAAYVRQFFAAPETGPFRERHGLLGIRPGDIRPLTDRNDAETCRRISHAVTLPENGPAPKVWTWYRAGDFYVVMIANERAAGAPRHAGGTGLILLDAEMRVLAAAS